MIIPEEQTANFKLGEEQFLSALYHEHSELKNFDDAMREGIDFAEMLYTQIEGSHWFLAGWMNAWKERTTPKNPSTREFYCTRILYEVLSEEPLPDRVTLSMIERECDEGGWSGKRLDTKREVIDGPTMAKLLLDQSTDPFFFQLTNTGEDIEI